MERSRLHGFMPRAPTGAPHHLPNRRTDQPRVRASHRPLQWGLAATALLIAGSLLAGTDEPREIRIKPLAPAAYGTPVDSVPALTRLDNWRAIDRDTLIVWATPRRPYLIELRRPSPDLVFAQTIGLGSSAFRVRAGLDSVIVRGIDYPIEAIFALDADDARALTRRTTT